jgi:hypothetical protein
MLLQIKKVPANKNIYLFFDMPLNKLQVYVLNNKQNSNL